MKIRRGILWENAAAQGRGCQGLLLLIGGLEEREDLFGFSAVQITAYPHVVHDYRPLAVAVLRWRAQVMATGAGFRPEFRPAFFHRRCLGGHGGGFGRGGGLLAAITQNGHQRGARQQQFAAMFFQEL